VKASAAIVALAACWTGAAPVAPPPPPARDLKVTLDRTSCLLNSSCPVYSVTITGDGVVLWRGIERIAALGDRRARVSPDKLDALDAAIDRVRFFELDDEGQPLPHPCTTANSSACRARKPVQCDGTPHAIVIVRRNGARHRVDDPNCLSRSPAVELEQLIDRVAGTQRWIAP